MNNLKGVGVALVTPFNEDLTVELLSQDWLSTTLKTEQLFSSLGTTAEAATYLRKKKKL